MALLRVRGVVRHMRNFGHILSVPPSQTHPELPLGATAFERIEQSASVRVVVCFAVIAVGAAACSGGKSPDGLVAEGCEHVRTGYERASTDDTAGAAREFNSARQIANDHRDDDPRLDVLADAVGKTDEASSTLIRTQCGV
jgi:hypothetical protein